MLPDIGLGNYETPEIAADSVSRNVTFLLTTIFGKMPDTHVLLSSIIGMPVEVHYYPDNPYNLTAQQEAYDNVVPFVAAQFGADKVTYVDMREKSKLCLPDTDGCCPPLLHPRGKGYAKMADVWYEAVIKWADGKLNAPLIAHAGGAGNATDGAGAADRRIAFAPDSMPVKTALPQR